MTITCWLLFVVQGSSPKMLVAKYWDCLLLAINCSSCYNFDTRPLRAHVLQLLKDFYTLFAKSIKNRFFSWRCTIYLVQKISSVTKWYKSSGDVSKVLMRIQNNAIDRSVFDNQFVLVYSTINIFCSYNQGGISTKTSSWLDAGRTLQF